MKGESEIDNTGRLWIALGAALAGLGVVAGAFGAHGLEGKLSPELLETFEVAVRYQMYHSLALVFVGLLATGAKRGLSVAGVMFLLGILLFSGCLYAWVFTGIKTFALIVPIGGVCFIVGWMMLAAIAMRGSTAKSDCVRVVQRTILIFRDVPFIWRSNMFRLLATACVCTILASLAGCGESGQARHMNDLKQAGLAYHNHHDLFQKGPSSWEELIETDRNTAAMVQPLPACVTLVTRCNGACGFPNSRMDCRKPSWPAILAAV